MYILVGVILIRERQHPASKPAQVARQRGGFLEVDGKKLILGTAVSLTAFMFCLDHLCVEMDKGFVGFCFLGSS